MTRRVVVTGAGAVTSVGIGNEAYWDALVQGRTGIRAISTFETSKLRSQIAGEIRDFDPLSFMDRSEASAMDRTSQLAMAAVALAGGDRLPAGWRTGVVVGTGIGGIATHDAAQKTYFEKGHRFILPNTIPKVMYNAGAGLISMRYRLTGPGFTVSTACASGSHAIGEAFRMIRHGYADVMVAGGMDATLSPNMFAGWCAMRILSQRNDSPETACRPFSKDRDGMVLGEGAAFVILEEMSSARARGATIVAEIVGYGSSYDASHITAPSADGQAAAMASALEEAGLGPADLDWINAHGTGTLLNDKTETRAVRMVLGDAAGRTPMSSIKPMVGHTLGASGAIAFVASCMAMRDGIIPPTINYTEPDPECDLDYVPNEARHTPVRRVMTNAFGFGGNNAVLIAERPEKP